jgi:hypothetical protein
MLQIDRKLYIVRDVISKKFISNSPYTPWRIWGRGKNNYMLPENIIYIGIAINFFSCIWYVKSVIYGNTKPNLVSWLIWSCAPFIAFFLQLKAGAGLSSSGVFLSGFGPLLVVICSLFKKNAFWKVQPLDLLCGFFSITALIIYIITSNLWMSIIFAVLSDSLGYIPTLIKTWKYPETENSSTYVGGTINNGLSLLILKNYTLAIFLFPLYLVIANLLEIYFIYHKKIFRKATS